MWDNPDLDDVDILTLFIMYEAQNPDSFFKPYICTLPKVARHVTQRAEVQEWQVAPQPAFYTPEQAAHAPLASPSLYHAVHHATESQVHRNVRA